MPTTSLLWHHSFISNAGTVRLDLLAAQGVPRPLSLAVVRITVAQVSPAQSCDTRSGLFARLCPNDVSVRKDVSVVGAI